MLQKEIEDKVLAILTKNGRDSTVVPTLESKFEDLKLESLDVMCTMFDVEEEFNITIPDGAAQNMRTVRDVVNSIAAELSSK